MARFERNSIKRSTAALMLALSLAVPVCACSPKPTETTVSKSTLSESERNESIAIKRNNRRVHEHVEKMLGFDIGDEYIVEAELLLDQASDETIGSVCMLINTDKELELLTLLQSKFGPEKNINASQITAYQPQYTEELKKMHNIKNWAFLNHTSSTSSIYVNIYMAQKGQYSYLYIIPM